MKKVISVPKEIVLDIQAKDIARTVASDIIKQLIEIHQCDSDAQIFESEVYKEFEKRAENKQNAWEQAKYNMAAKYVPSDIPVRDWNLNYNSCKLTIIVDCQENSCTVCNCKE